MPDPIQITKGRLDGLIFSRTEAEDGTLIALLVEVDTLPGFKAVLEASAAEELWTVLGIVLRKVS